MTSANTQARRRYLHWVVLAFLGVWPFLRFLDHNRDDALFYGTSVLGYATAFVAGLFILTLLGRMVLGPEREANIANALGVGAVCLFSYLLIDGGLSALGISLGTVKIAIWLVVTLTLMTLTWRLSAHANTSTVLLAISLALLVLPVSRLVLFSLEAGRIDANADASGTTVAAATVVSSQPNVYWIILDAYPRADVLEAYFGYRNEGFLTELRKRGFFVAGKSFSNYASTKFSLSTTANMDYYLPTGEKLHPGLWTPALQGFNRAVDRFQARGYRYVHADPGGNNRKTRCGGRESVCVTSESTGLFDLNEADIGLLRLTPVYRIVRTTFPELIAFGFNGFQNMTAKLKQWPEPPVFAFIHILSPHPPRRFDRNCNALTDVSHDLVGAGADNTSATFINDLRCLNLEVIEFVDTVIAKDAADPIILLQGDHGYRGNENELPNPSLPAIDRRLIRFANLNAIRLPKRCMGMARDDMTSVNTLRLVLTCLGDTDLPQVDDVIFAHDKTSTRKLDINREVVR